LNSVASSKIEPIADQRDRQLEERMRQKMSLTSRRELIDRVGLRYRISTWKEKGKILDEFVSGSGYSRKHAITLLNHGISPPGPKKRMSPRRYDEAVRRALITIWKAANCICSKRLIPFLPVFVEALGRFGHISLPAEVLERLLSISPATADRLLYEERNPEGHSPSTTRPGKLLKHKIAVRTFFDWNELAPGFMEADLVAHCGESIEGSYLNTLVLTDIATGWTECVALLCRREADISGAIHATRQFLPFPLLGLDTDNGSEFINYELLRYCEKEKITFTRSRAYRKNDQAHVEEKNGSIVRRLVGYDRYEGMDAWKALTSLYEALRLYVNFFQPSMKLISKERIAGHTTKHYDKAKTPYQRALDADAIGEEQKSRLRASYQNLDPLKLLNELEHLQDQFWVYAHKKPANPLLELSEGKTIRQNSISNEPIAIAPFPNLQAPVMRLRSSRSYRRSEKPRVLHTWRTRKDPFADVWGQVQLQVDRNPSRSVKELFLELQQQYPGKFSDGQLRTLERRVKQRRRELLNLSEAHQMPWPSLSPELQIGEGL
jgi:hypothetical protein